jgi:hypothetical protein
MQQKLRSNDVVLDMNCTYDDMRNAERWYLLAWKTE